MKNIICKKKRITSIIQLLLLAVLITCCFSKNVMAKSIMPPENVSVQMKSATSLKIKWSKCEKADGYIVYRYNKKAKKYVRVHTAKKNQRSWVDKNLKTGKIYQYKVASYKIVKGKKKRSKKSYAVSAIAHTKKSKKVNALFVSLYANRENEMGICSELLISDDIIGEDSKVSDPVVISNKLVWSSSDETVAKVDQNGKVTAMDKEGTCYITARAHNGVKEKIKIVNYARPKSFPYYNGDLDEVNLMLTTYRENVFNIATYFTIRGDKNTWGTIKMDDAGNIIGIPDFDDITVIQSDIQTILENFPVVTEIQFSGKNVCFFMKYDKYGNSYCKISYYALNDMSDNPSQIAPHWTATAFAPY
ncbi:MAG: Ig-like domain-containing protein [Lachnospiraceae bacterium]|nr:Ig-like domain-containing protein [Lachnospiraceae bacterium]